MPFLANLLLYRQTGQRKRRMDRALCLLEYGADQMINGRLFPNVPSLRATSRQGYLGHARPPISRRFFGYDRLPGGGSCVKLAQEEKPTLRQKKGGKRGSLFTYGYILNIPACSLADRCEGAPPSLKMARYQPTAGRVTNAVRPLYDALAPAGAWPLRGPSLGSANLALGGRARLYRGLDRRAPYRTLGAAPFARPVDRAGADGDPAHPARSRWFSAALPPSRRASQPCRHARSHGSGPAQFRRRRERPSERLGDVQRRRQLGATPRDDPRGPRHHSQAVDRGGTLRLRRQILEGDQDRPDAAHVAAAYPAVAEALPADRRRRRQQGLGDLEARRRARVFADEPQPEPRLRREPLGVGRGRSAAYRAYAAAGRLAPRARDLRCRQRCRGVAPIRRGNDGAYDARIFPAAADRCRRHPIPEARSGGRRQRCHPGILRPAQLADRLAGDRRREDRADV